MARTVHDRHARYSRTQSARIAITARLAKSDWREMTEAARSSPANPANLDKWREKARAENPGLDDDQLDRQAERLRSAYYRELGRRSGEARRARSSGDE